MGKFIQEFKEFAMKGNVVDMAVGVIIGGAFGKIVSSLVNDVIMPLVTLITGGVNFTDKKIVLREAVMNGQEILSPEVALTWGVFVQSIVDFLIIAFCIFMAIRFMNKLKSATEKAEKEEAAAPSATDILSKDQELLTEIRDILKQKSESGK